MMKSFKVHILHNQVLKNLRSIHKIGSSRSCDQCGLQVHKNHSDERDQNMHLHLSRSCQAKIDLAKYLVYLMSKITPEARRILREEKALRNKIR